jgi:methylated-DNA-[protein]-cysteine S-methyltransferase
MRQSRAAGGVSRAPSACAARARRALSDAAHRIARAVRPSPRAASQSAWRAAHRLSRLDESLNHASTLVTPVLATYRNADTTAVQVARVPTPLGVVHVASFEQGVCALIFDDRAATLEPRLRRAFGPFFRIEPGDPHGVARRLARYFGGNAHALQDIPLAAPATPMQRRVWDMVRGVPPGAVTTYAALAERMGMPRAQRAVGVCLASNPVPILVPCHRVIAASGGLGSHPGGVGVKAALLRHEGVVGVREPCAPRTLRARLSARDRSALAPDDSVELVALPLA